MLLFRTLSSWWVQTEPGFGVPLFPESAGTITCRDDLFEYLTLMAGTSAPKAIPNKLLLPLGDQEIWAAGVTYHRSRAARIAESKAGGGGDFYDRVYDADRPELFFKATPHRAVGPGANVRIRRDSNWNVPEPELALLISPGGRILGYTIGNDMSSREIEGANPLFLPQAKTYDKCCSLGPAILVTRESLPRSTGIHLQVHRDGQTVFQGSTALSEMKRRLEDLVAYLFRESSFPNGCVLLTGTGIIPPDGFSLAPGDRIEIAIDGIGVLVNTVEQASDQFNPKNSKETACVA